MLKILFEPLTYAPNPNLYTSFILFFRLYNRYRIDLEKLQFRLNICIDKFYHKIETITNR